MDIFNYLGEKEEIEKICNPQEVELLEKSLKYAIKVHSGQIRKTGEEYVHHPISVAKKLWELFHNVELSCAAFLHDTIEDCRGVTQKKIYEIFGENIGFLVDSVTKTKKKFYLIKDLSFEDKTERLLFAGIKDIRVLLLKIADRENNLETLAALKEKKQVRMAFETQAIYEPLKKILGYGQQTSIQECREKFKYFLNKQNITTAPKLKEKLYGETFENFDEKSFGLVYRNSADVIWRIEGLDMFRKLCKLETFKDKIELINVQSNGSWLNADFKFLKGAITRNKDIKMRISTFGAK